MLSPKNLSVYYTPVLLAILLFAFVTRMYRLHLPERYIFDEVYHAVTAKLIARNDLRAYEWWNPPVEPNTAVDWLHPPLAKYTQAAAMLFFGENSFGWRISSALFGVLTIFLIARLSHQLTNSAAISLLSALLASLDGLLLVQSRIAMNDIHVTFFILLAINLYLKTNPFRLIKTATSPTPIAYKWYLFTGIAAGCAMSTKWSGVFVVGVLIFFESIRTLYEALFRKNWLSHVCTKLLLISASFIIIPISVYLLSYAHMFMQGKKWSHFVELHQQIIWYQTNLTATHSYQSKPLDWIINKKPVWYHVDYTIPTMRADIYAQGNTILYLSGLAAIGLSGSAFLSSLIYSVRQKKHRLKNILEYVLSPTPFLLAAYLSMWIIWLDSPRIMFFYHYTPAVPFLVSILSSWLVALYSGRILSDEVISRVIFWLVLFLIAVNFIVFFPHWTGIHVPTQFVDSIYFFFDSWR